MLVPLPLLISVGFAELSMLGLKNFCSCSDITVFHWFFPCIYSIQCSTSICNLMRALGIRNCGIDGCLQAICWSRCSKEWKQNYALLSLWKSVADSLEIFLNSWEFHLRQNQTGIQLKSVCSGEQTIDSWMFFPIKSLFYFMNSTYTTASFFFPRFILDKNGS